MENVFVYGSLLSGFWNHDALLSEVQCTGKATLTAKLSLYHLKAGYPALIESTKENTIIGEVYAVNAKKLQKLDNLEGYDESRPEVSHYRRDKVQVIVNGETIEAWVYILQRKLSSVAFLVEDGDWRKFINREA